MTNVLLVIHLVLCLGLIILVLIQRSEGGALSGLGGGGGGGGMGGLMTGRSASNLLTRATALLAAGFMVTSLILSLLANADRNSGSILDDDSLTPITQEAPAAPKPTEPGAPLAK
ncbi:preprotein translocase subunit SecG [Terasakiella sp. A23]|uniref:preprotein translocase subunit SecG n=1 Tax=Terasakiella sp. FCG-A23 TaxID=3080561 RepID=UPI0029546AB5|nr:preprotein translocase subunit SecG [Terasakiella sp. A23]MDV7338896.1 preprotein translocase subunit SecG [Terasakiella sp. A23]